MKMAKPSERDIDAAGDLMALLHQLDRGDYPNIDEDADVPDWFDENNYEHLRAFYDAIKATLDKGPGYPGRVIGGMCYVIMYDKNEIVDPASDTLDLHPKIVKALTAVDAQAEQAAAVRAAALEEAANEAEHWQQINTSHKCGEYIAAAIRALADPSTATSNDTGAPGDTGGAK